MALQIAALIHEGDQRVARGAFGKAPLLAMLPIFCFASKYDGRDDLHEIKPRLGGFVREILIFGSTARNEESVGDLDMMILDDGFYSPFFEPKPKTIRDRTKPALDWYSELADHLKTFLSGWLGYKGTGTDPWDYELVDLHVLPVSALWSDFARERIGKLHHDPRFLDNAFSSLLRFNCIRRCFEPTTLEKLRQKHVAADPEENEERR